MSSTTKSPYEIIVRPIVTEKTVRDSDVEEKVSKKYTFQVAQNANKYEIKWALETIQQDIKAPINIIDVHTMKVRAKARNGRFFKRANKGHTSAWKKAIVTLKVGQQIDLIEGV
jgi:large subunit ribosomal protein L23